MWDSRTDEIRLFDLKTDPGELRSIATEQPEKAQEMLTLLLDWKRRKDERGRAPVSGINELDAAQRQRLKALGYLQ